MEAKDVAVVGRGIRQRTSGGSRPLGCDRQRQVGFCHLVQTITEIDSGADL